MEKFKNFKCLTNNEVYELLKNDKNNNYLHKSILEYVKSVKIDLTRNQVKQIRKFLTKYKLDEYEIALFGNLFPGTFEEAKTIINSIGERLNDTEIKEIVDYLCKYDKSEISEHSQNDLEDDLSIGEKRKRNNKNLTNCKKKIK